MKTAEIRAAGVSLPTRHSAVGEDAVVAQWREVSIGVDRAGARRLSERLTRLAPWVLGISVVVQLAGAAIAYYRLNVDLHVYVLGASALNAPNALYDVSYPDKFANLPFTYPPFAAMLFYPLQWMPFVVVAFGWKVATIAAVYGMIRLSQRMIGGSKRMAMLWTAIGIWIEPVRTTLDLGQVNVFLVVAVLYAAWTSRPWLSGLLVGIAAGVKLTPAVAGVYLVGMRRWRAAVASAAVFAASIGLSALIFPDETNRYFTELLGDVKRVGMVGLVANQSWRGTLSRIAGHDVGGELVLFAVITATAILAALAWRALGTGLPARDPLGSLLVVQLFGLTALPISWAHHWVWVLPLLLWLFHGPWRDQAGAAVLRWLWFSLTLLGVPTMLSMVPQPLDEYSRPWYLACGEAVYVPMTLVTFAWIIFASRAVSRCMYLPSQPKTESAPPTSAVGLTPVASRAQRPSTG